MRKNKNFLIGAFYRRNRLTFGMSLAATAAISSINLVLAWLMQQMIDTASGVVGAYSLSSLVLLTLGIIAAIVAIKMITAIVRPRFMRRAMEQYKSDAFCRLTQKSIASLGGVPSAGYLTAFSADAAIVEQNYLDVTFDLLFDLVLMAGAMAMMLVYSPLLTAVALGLFLLPIAVSLLAGKGLKRAEQTVSEKHERFLATLSACLDGFTVMKSFRAESVMQRLLTEDSGRYEQAKCRRTYLQSILSMLGGVAGVAAQFGTFLAGIALAAAGAGITPGTLLIFVDLTGNVIRPIEVLPARFASRRAARGLIDKLEHTLMNEGNDGSEAVPAALMRGIMLEDVSFAYAGQSEVLHHLDFTFAAGKSYAIVGPSGSGKSTLLALLMRSCGEYRGSIRYDDVELRAAESQSLYETVSLIGQEVFLFDDSVVNNITLYRNFSTDAVKQAIDQAGLSSFQDTHGTAYRCGEAGACLSGGEKQRIAIARALLRKSSVLLCDEITSALDAETARQVTEAILRRQEMTRIAVTHNLDEVLLRQYDCILVMKEGRIVESGKYDALMDAHGVFYALAACSL